MSKIKVSTEELGQSFSDLVIYEVDPYWSREKVIIAESSGDLKFGTVLTREAEASEYKPLKGEGDAVAVLIQDVPDNEAKQEALVIRRGAVLNGDKLVFESEAEANKDKALLKLSDLGIAIVPTPSVTE